MKVAEIERYQALDLFESFLSSLTLLLQNDRQLLLMRSARFSVAYRLAYYLNNKIEEPYLIDMSYPLLSSSNSLVSDVLVHNRSKNSKPLLALIVRQRYLNEGELLNLHQMRTVAECELPLAISLLPNKEYLLIYRANDYSIDYYHYRIDEHHCHLLRRREIEDFSSDSTQLKLGIRARRRAESGQ